MRPLFNSQVFYAEEGGGSETPAPQEEKTTIELLNEEDIKEDDDEPLDLSPAKKAKEEDGEKEESSEPEGEEDELKEIEDELKEPDEEDLELTTPVRRKEILAKYPKLFKDFPYLEKAYYREQQFTELLPTVQDARIAVEKARFLDKIDGEVMNGDIRSVLGGVKQQDPEAFNRIADNYLPALRAIDERAYYNVLGNVIKDTIITMVKEGRALGEQGAPLQAAANVLNQFVFGSQNFTPPQNLARNARPEQKQWEEQQRAERQKQIYGQFENTRGDLQNRADNVLMATIDQHMDPKGSMTDYVKGHAVKEAHAMLEDLISKDSRFRGLLDKLWEKAFERGFDKESTERIKSAYLSKAKTLLPSVIKKARSNALKGMGGRSSNTEQVQEDRTERRSSNNNQGRSTPPQSGKIRKAGDIPKGMSTLDFLMKD